MHDLFRRWPLIQQPRSWIYRAAEGPFALLAVSPVHRRKGRGGSLLAHHHQRLDLTGLPAMAEVGPARQGLYRRPPAPPA